MKATIIIAALACGTRTAAAMNVSDPLKGPDFQQGKNMTLETWIPSAILSRASELTWPYNATDVALQLLDEGVEIPRWLGPGSESSSSVELSSKKQCNDICARCLAGCAAIIWIPFAAIV